mgnify:CR=1 FL=1
MARFYTMILLVWGEKAYNRLYIIALLCAVFLLEHFPSIVTRQ